MATASNSPNNIPTDLSFCFSIAEVSPKFIQTLPLDTWLPPVECNNLNTNQPTCFKWQAGRVRTSSPTADPKTHSVATVFTQTRGSENLCAVTIDARSQDVADQNGGWRNLSFNHLPAPDNRVYSSLNLMGQEGHLAAPGSPNWVPQLIPHACDYRPQHNPGVAPKPSAGLIGDIPLLLALAAFSASEGLLIPTMTQNIRPGLWVPHNRIAGSK